MFYFVVVLFLPAFLRKQTLVSWLVCTGHAHRKSSVVPLMEARTEIAAGRAYVPGIPQNQIFAFCSSPRRATQLSHTNDFLQQYPSLGQLVFQDIRYGQQFSTILSYDWTRRVITASPRVLSTSANTRQFHPSSKTRPIHLIPLAIRSPHLTLLILVAWRHCEGLLDLAADINRVRPTIDTKAPSSSRLLIRVRIQ